MQSTAQQTAVFKIFIIKACSLAPNSEYRNMGLLEPWWGLLDPNQKKVSNESRLYNSNS